MYLYEARTRPTRFEGVPVSALAEASAPTCSRTLDATAKAIIKDAQDPAYGKHSRAVRTVWSIVKTYYPANVGLVAAVIFLDGESGLSVTSSGSPRMPPIRGIFKVGPSFIDNTTERFFARRVLQVGHELQHIQQWRSGMRGAAFKNEREFLAHYWTATTREFPGTGCMQHATRVGIIDCALGNYFCMSADKQAEYAARRERLLALRRTEEAASGRPATSPPAVCDTNRVHRNCG
jgi:hypothetical protein